MQSFIESFVLLSFLSVCTKQRLFLMSARKVANLLLRYDEIVSKVNRLSLRTMRRSEPLARVLVAVAFSRQSCLLEFRACNPWKCLYFQVRLGKNIIEWFALAFIRIYLKPVWLHSLGLWCKVRIRHALLSVQWPCTLRKLYLIVRSGTMVVHS